MIRALSFVASLAVLAVAAPAAAETVQRVFETYRLPGTFAVDCGKPASAANIWQVIRLVDADTAQIDVMSGASTVAATFLVDRAEAVGPDFIRIGGTLNELPLEIVWHVTPQRQRFTEISVKRNTIVRDGIDLVTLQATSYYGACPGPGEKRANGAEPGEPPTYEGRVEDWIGGNLLFVESPTGGVKKVDLSLDGIVDRGGSAQEAQETRIKLEAFAKGRIIRCWRREDHRHNVCYLDGTDIALWALKQKLVRPSKTASPEYVAGAQ